MAEQNEAPAGEPEIPVAPVSRLPRLNFKAMKPRSANTVSRPREGARERRLRGAKPGPVRSIATGLIVSGLVATVAIPAYAAWQPTDEVPTIQKLAEAGAQSLVVASDIDVDEQLIDRDSYAATTPEEIQEKKDKEAAEAEEARRQEAAAAVASAAQSSSGPVAVDAAVIPQGSGSLGWPVGNMTTMTDMFGARGGTHNGVDMLAPAGSPIFAAADGVVSASTDSGGAWGAYVRVEHVVNGQRISTLYAHMTYGTRAVQPGDTVSRGQVLGGVGRTGLATANHLHFEVYVGGTRVDPMGWL